MQFIIILRTYFTSIHDGEGSKSYIKNVVYFICSKCVKAKKSDVEKFVAKISEIFIRYLYEIVEKNIELNALYQMLTISNRELIQIISENQDNMIKFMDSLSREQIEITDKEIDRYHDACLASFSIIRFTGIAGAENKRQQNLNEFYVENTFGYYCKDVRRHFKVGINYILFLPLMIHETTNTSRHDTVRSAKLQLLVAL